jgi:hypothetical protein
LTNHKKCAIIIVPNEREEIKMKNEISKAIIKFLGTVSFWLTSSLFLWWGWNVLAPHLNAPMFSYWEIFAIRMMFSYSISIIVKSIANTILTVKKGKEEEND